MRRFDLQITFPDDDIKILYDFLFDLDAFSPPNKTDRQVSSVSDCYVAAKSVGVCISGMLIY